MELSNEVSEIFNAMSNAQGLFTTLEKTSSGYGYNYAELKESIEMMRPHLAEHGLFFSQSIKENESGLDISTFIGHKSGQWIKTDYMRVPLINMKGVNAAQEMGAIVTYGKRYCLEASFGIATKGADTDGVTRNDLYPNKPKQEPKAKIENINTTEWAGY